MGRLIPIIFAIIFFAILIGGSVILLRFALPLIILYFIFYFVRKFTKNFFKTTSNDQKESDHKYSNQQKDIVDVDYEEVE